MLRCSSQPREAYLMPSHGLVAIDGIDFSFGRQRIDITTLLAALREIRAGRLNANARSRTPRAAPAVGRRAGGQPAAVQRPGRWQRIARCAAQLLQRLCPRVLRGGTTTRHGDRRRHTRSERHRARHRHRRCARDGDAASRIGKARARNGRRPPQQRAGRRPSVRTLATLGALDASFTLPSTAASTGVLVGRLLPPSWLTSPTIDLEFSDGTTLRLSTGVQSQPSGIAFHGTRATLTVPNNAAPDISDVYCSATRRWPR